MTNVSTGRKLGIVARVAGKQIKASRAYTAVLSGVRASVGHFAAVLRQLWHEITGFVFLAFAAFGAGLSRTVLATYLPAFFFAGALCVVASLIVLLISRAPKPLAAKTAMA